jgi:hypothetical protein
MATITKYEYVEIEDSPEFKSLRVKTIKGFAKMLQHYQVKLIFRTEKCEADNKLTREFMFLENQTIYRLNSNLFKTVEDYEDAANRDFPDAESFYEAQQAGIGTYKEYQDCKKTGIVDKQVYIKAQKHGFMDAFEKFTTKCAANILLIPKNFDLNEYDTPIKLSEYAGSKGFKDYGDFEKAFFLGFTDKITFDDARQKGFTYAEDYLNAVKMGFELVKEYQEAKHLNIQSKFEYNHYILLKNAAQGKYSFDQIMMINALKKIENGKKLSLKKLLDLLQQTEDEVKFKTGDNGSHSLPEWYVKKMNNEDDIRIFFTQEQIVKQYGIFDMDGEYFEVWKISNQKIYVDGNNVAFTNSRKRENPNGDDKPHCSNIKIVVDELIKQRFEEIFVIGDPGLKRRSADVAILTRMINDKQISYHEAPSLTEADEFFIKKAKADKCYIVSNDTFRDWRVKDPWIAENIDRIRIPFMIEGNNVTLSGIEKLV